MKKNLLFFLVPILLVLAFGPATAAPVFQPHEMEYNFDPVPEGKIVEHAFSFRNAGDKVLRILKVMTGCNCTAITFTEKLLPGEEGIINVELDTMGYAGMYVPKIITVTTNDPANKTVKLSLKGMVTRFAEVEPEAIHLYGMEGEEIVGGVKIQPLLGYPFRIKSSHVRTGKDFRYEIFSSEEGRTAYHIRARNIRKEPGAYYDLITLDIDSPVRKTFSIRVLGNVRAKKTVP